MHYVIALSNIENKRILFLRRNRHDQFLFDSVPNVKFNTEEAAINFIQHNSDKITCMFKEDEKPDLMVIPVEEKELRARFVERE